MSDEYEGNKRREMRWEQMRGTPLPKSTDEVWKERHLLQEQHIAEIENRLRALWDKYDGDRKHYMARIKRLEEAGDALLSHSHCTNYHEKVAEWNEAKRIRL